MLMPQFHIKRKCAVSFLDVIETGFSGHKLSEDFWKSCDKKFKIFLELVRSCLMLLMLILA